MNDSDIENNEWFSYCE